MKSLLVVYRAKSLASYREVQFARLKLRDGSDFGGRIKQEPGIAVNTMFSSPVVS
jgi:hypothetical protein